MDVNASNLWDKILKIFKNNTSMETEYNAFFKNVKADDFSNNILSLNCNSPLMKEKMEKYKNEIEETLNDIFILSNEKIHIVFNIKKEEEPGEISYRIKEYRSTNQNSSMKTGLNVRNRLDNFIVGDNSRMAYNACLAVLENEAPVYNPLFIYGGSGLGKTHLMQAVGNAILERNPEKRVLYTTTEEFSNE